jgi:hypothetical protein
LAELIKHQIDGPVGPAGCAAAEYVAYVGSGSWLRDNALTQPATVHDPVNVV